jgi:hypothetical protein
VFNLRLVIPFYFADFVFYGHKLDIQKIFLFSVPNYFSSSMIITDTQWYNNPFIIHHPILQDYFQIINTNVLTQALKEWSGKTEDSKFYLPRFLNRVFSVLLLIYYTQFLLYPDENVDKNANAALQFKELFSFDKYGRIRKWSRPTICSQAVIEKTVNGGIDPSMGYIKFYSTMMNREELEHGCTKEEYNELVVFGEQEFGLKREGWLYPFKKIEYIENKNIAADIIESNKILFSDYYNEKDMSEFLEIIKEILVSKDYSGSVENNINNIKDTIAHDRHCKILETLAREDNKKALAYLSKAFYDGRINAVDFSQTQDLRYISRVFIDHSNVTGDVLYAAYYYIKNKNINLDLRYKMFTFFCKYFSFPVLSKTDGVDYDDTMLCLLREMLDTLVAEDRFDYRLPGIVAFFIKTEEGCSDALINILIKNGVFYLAQEILEKYTNVYKNSMYSNKFADYLFMNGDEFVGINYLLSIISNATIVQEKIDIVYFLLRETKAKDQGEIDTWLSSVLVENNQEENAVLEIARIRLILSKDIDVDVADHIGTVMKICVDSEFVLLCKTLLDFKSLESNRLLILNQAVENRKRIFILELLVCFERNQDILFFTIKNQETEIWIQSRIIKSNPLIQEFEVKRSWPSASRRSDCAIAGFFRFADSKIQYSFEFGDVIPEHQYKKKKFLRTVFGPSTFLKQDANMQYSKLYTKGFSVNQDTAIAGLAKEIVDTHLAVVDEIGTCLKNIGKEN